MNSRAVSNVHICSANAPLVCVFKHKNQVQAIPQKKELGLSRNDSVTNEFLKRGGTLPSVLPAGDWKEVPLKKDSFGDNVEQSHTHRSSSGTKNKHQKKSNKAVNLYDANNVRPSCLEFKKQVEQLNCKMSLIQSILLNQELNGIEGTQKTVGNESFSAHEYTSLILGINGKVSSLHAYDPAEFSDTCHR